MWRVVTAAGALALALGACGAAEGEAPPEAQEPVDVVVIGDSIAETGWAEQYAEKLQSELDRPTRPHVESTMTIPDAVKAVETGGAAQDAIAGAEVVVVEVGYNNALPWPGTGVGCGGEAENDSSAAYADWARTTDRVCLAEWVKTYGELYDQVLVGIKRLRGDQPTVYVTMGAPNADLAPVKEFPDWLLAGFKPQQWGKEWLGSAYDRWNTMIEERSSAAGYQYVDIYRAFNGEDARSAYYPELTDDGVHPNQAGNDVIVEQLGDVDLSAVSDS